MSHLRSRCRGDSRRWRGWPSIVRRDTGSPCTGRRDCRTLIKHTPAAIEIAPFPSEAPEEAGRSGGRPANAPARRRTALRDVAARAASRSRLPPQPNTSTPAWAGCAVPDRRSGSIPSPAARRSSSTLALPTPSIPASPCVSASLGPGPTSRRPPLPLWNASALPTATRPG